MERADGEGGGRRGTRSKSGRESVIQNDSLFFINKSTEINIVAVTQLKR